MTASARPCVSLGSARSPDPPNDYLDVALPVKLFDSAAAAVLWS